MAGARGLDRVNVAEDVGDGHVGRGEFFDEARVALDPGNRRVVALALDRLPTVGGDGPERVVVYLRARDDGYRRGEQGDELSDDAALGSGGEADEGEVV